MNPEFILLAVGVGLTVLAGIVVFASMRRAAVPPSRGDASAGAPLNQPLGTTPHPGDSPVVSADKIILRGLQSLLERDSGGGFVIFEHPATKRFVQFTRTNDGIMLDLPLLELSDGERSRARDLFASHGRAPTQSAGGARAVEIYQADFGADVDSATRTALAVFRKVFGIDGDLPLYVKTD